MLTAASIRRQIRRHIHKNTFDVFIICPPGLEHDTAEDLIRLLPRQSPTFTTGGLSTQAALSEVYRMNLGLRTANRILLRLNEFSAWSFPMLHDHASRVLWPAFLPNPRKVRVRVATQVSKLNMKERIEETIRSAIRGAFGDYPGQSQASADVFVRIVSDRVTVSLDTTGQHLHIRGDKPHPHIAPLRSTLAAAALERAFNDQPNLGVICDPFCGSGTVAAEALRLIRGIAPGEHRRFAFEDHPYFSVGTWRKARRDDARERHGRTSAEVVAGDIQQSAVDVTRLNLRHVDEGESDDVATMTADYGVTLRRATESFANGVVVTNPPYGVRLSSNRDAKMLLARLTESLAELPPLWRFSVFTPWPEALVNHEALSITRETRLNVGGLPVRLVEGQPRARGR